MKKPKLKFWHLIAGYIIFATINTIIWYLPPSQMKSLIFDLIDQAAVIWAALLFYVIVRNIILAIKGLIARRSSGEAEELERKREIERKEIDMVRKSNEILLHLIQDEHREEGDR